MIVGGQNGVLSAYTPGGELVGSTNVQPHIDQCSTGSKGNLVVCAGRGIVTVVAVATARPASRRADGYRAHRAHTAGIDESTGDMWIVWGDSKGDWVQRLKFTP